MKRMLVLSVSGLMLASLNIPDQNLVRASDTKASPLVQILELTGDRTSGFMRSCLLVRTNGEYHREIIRQKHPNNRATPDWESPEIFESTVNAGDLQDLKEIAESESFRTINGTVGGPVNLGSSLGFWVDGVTPLDYLHVFEASVAHSSGPQFFEILEMPARGPEANSIKLFRRWIAGVEKRKDGRLQNGTATNCAISPGIPDEPLGLTATHLVPKPTYTPGPEYPAEERNAKHTGTVTIRALINSDGSVRSVSVRHGINRVLDQCALDAVKKWKFAPALLVGIAVPMSTDVEVHFRL